MALLDTCPTPAETVKAGIVAIIQSPAEEREAGAKQCGPPWRQKVSGSNTLFIPCGRLSRSFVCHLPEQLVTAVGGELSSRPSHAPQAGRTIDTNADTRDTSRSLAAEQAMSDNFHTLNNYHILNRANPVIIVSPPAWPGVRRRNRTDGCAGTRSVC